MCHDRLTAPIRGGSGIVEERVRVAVEDGDLPAYLARPETGDAPGVLIVHDFYGASPFYEDLARRLAGEGFAALLPDFYVREEPVVWRDRDAAFARAKRHDQVRALRDIQAALAALRGRNPVGKAGMIGFCMGGTLVMLAAARQPGPDAAVSFYGFPAGHAAWPGWPLNPIDETERVSAPLLALVGDADAGVGMDVMADYEANLRAAGADYRQVIYPGQPHGFLTFDPASPAYDASTAAMGETLAFLRERLGGGA